MVVKHGCFCESIDIEQELSLVSCTTLHADLFNVPLALLQLAGKPSHHWNKEIENDFAGQCLKQQQNKCFYMDIS